MSVTKPALPECPYCCASDHVTPEACPKVSSIQYYPPDVDGVGEIKRIEFFPETESRKKC